MSARLLLSKPWAEARSSRAAAAQHGHLQYTVPSLRRMLSSDKQPSESPAVPRSKHHTTFDNSRTLKRSRNRKIFSLIQPTGVPHLGNYLGALRTWKDYQDQNDASLGRSTNHTLTFGIADLHSLTSKQTAEERRDQIRRTFASLLAIGLDPKKSLLFLQSDVSGHSELMWILSNVASVGYLSRMTQWKDKIGMEDAATTKRSFDDLDDKSKEKLKLSLFSYPVLQAADILLHLPDTVPVGEDQAQHVEFTRSLARSFNATYCSKENPVFRVPELILSPAKRVMSLQDPKKKMSKSDPNYLSRILITDPPETITNKIKKALTDPIPGPITYSPSERPGVSNLIDIYRHIQRDTKDHDAIVADLKDVTLGGLKALVAEAVIKELDGVREKYLELVDNNVNDTLDQAILSGRKMARARAGATMSKVREAIGLYTAGGRPPSWRNTEKGQIEDEV